MSLVKFVAILAAATVSQLYVEALYRQTVVAQSFAETPDSFPVPDSLPDGTTLKVDGSTSMRLTNETLEQRFEEQFPNIDVELDASRTDKALEALVNGDIDVLATGRPLTDAEKAQGVVEVPLDQREKLAIILGPDNTFEGELTFEQFAGIFWGEITNWSEIGGPDSSIRLVDRPNYSDTRRALSTYNVFEDKPFEAGETADPVADDETDTVVKALNEDGIGYAVVSQVIDRDDVRIIPMHQTLPDDPRYPYSQYRAFAYKEGAGPATLAFIGFATTEPGQEVFASKPAAAAANVPATAGTSAPTPESEVLASNTTSELAAAETATGRGGFPHWLLPLLAIPLLGILLWWLLKRDNSSASAAPAAAAGAVPEQPRLVLTPRDCRHAYAYWEIAQDRLTTIKRQGGKAMTIRLYDVTGRSKHSPLPTPAAEFSCVETNPDLHLPIALDNRSYCAEIGYLGKDNQWLPIVKSDPVRVPICPEKDAPSETISAVSMPAVTIPAKSSGNSDVSASAVPVSAKVAGAASVVVGAAAIGTNAQTAEEKSPPLPPAQTLPQPLDAKDPAGKDLADEVVEDASTTSNRDLSVVGMAAATAGGLAASVRDEDQPPSEPLTESPVIGQDAPDAISVEPTSSGTTQIVKVHSRNNAVVFDEDQRRHIEYDVASTHQLTAGTYTLRLRDGVFSYDADEKHPGEPFVLLWIHGGTVINQKTGVHISSTWTTLNGYDDTLILDVREPAKLCAFFVDTYPDDNLGEVTLSVIQQ